MNIYDIAREAGVSISTVSRVLNKKSNVTPETLKKVEAVLEKYNYTPSAIARGLVASSMKTVAVLTVDVRVPHYARTAYVIERGFSAKGYNVTLCNTGGELEETVKYLRIITEKQTDGIVLVGSVFNRLGREPRVAALLSKTPVVLANGRLEMPNSYSVLVDDRLGIRLAVEHLYKKGHRDIFYVQELHTESADIKRDGFVLAMSRLGFAEPEKNIVQAEYSLEGSIRAAEQLIASGRKFTAVVCGEDLTAVGMLKGLHRAGLRVPQDVAVTGFNNSDYTRMCEPELTCVDNKAEMVGTFSVQLLEHLIEGKGDYSSMIIQPELVVRGTT